MSFASLEIEEFLTKMKKLQQQLLELAEADSYDDEKCLDFILLEKELEIRRNPDELRALIHLISKIYQDYHYQPSFTEYTQNIILNIKDDIIKYYSNADIYNFFKNNKSILLFLIKSHIINIDDYVASKLRAPENIYYFLPEIKEFCPKALYDEVSQKITNDFEKHRLIGENISKLCLLIRNDNIEEFISYINLKGYNLSSTIKKSKFETNHFLIDKETTLIEYAAFFGSIRIFDYLLQNKVELNSNIWPYAIHGKNAEIIQYLETNRIKPKDGNYQLCYLEALKCHHNDIADYIYNTFLNANECDLDYTNYFYSYYNFELIQNTEINTSILIEWCRSDYVYLLAMLLKYKSGISLLIYNLFYI